MWQDPLPPESNKPEPRPALLSVLARWGNRLGLAAVPVAVAAAVVVRSLGYTVVGDLLGGFALLLLAGFAAEPLWRRSRRRAVSWWR
jgi:hypothetical protein